MIQLFTQLLGGRTWVAWLALTLLGIATLGGIYAYGDHQGSYRTELEWTAKYQARENELNQRRIQELDRQAIANATAKAAEDAALAELQRQRDESQALADRLAAEAAADPNAARVGLDASAVERLNRIHG